MAAAAHPARDVELAPTRRVLASLVALGLTLAPIQVRAEPPEETAPEATDGPTAEVEAGPTSAGEADEASAPPETGAEAANDVGTDEAEATGEAEVTDEAEATEANDADEAEVTADDEADDTSDDADGAATSGEPLRPLQTAAWWTMFGAFSVGTTAGVLAGLAERQEDRATRLSTLFDAQTGAQPLYADRQDEYEDYLRRGRAYARAAIGVGVLAGVTTIAAITLFAVDARRQRAERPRPRSRAALRLSPGGMEVRF